MKFLAHIIAAQSEFGQLPTVLWLQIPFATIVYTNPEFIMGMQHEA
ncbi:RNA polymerase binding protein [Salmonella phage 19]|nr:RNA polymerase binding protein [Salmonella phage 19]